MLGMTQVIIRRVRGFYCCRDFSNAERMGELPAQLYWVCVYGDWWD